MKRLGRRAFLAGGTAAVISQCAEAPRALGRDRADAAARALVPDPAGILALPEGYSYRVLQQVGARMDDGYRVPARPDAMGCFRTRDGSLALMRNHEVPVGFSRAGPYHADQAPPPEAYDPAAYGGVTRLLIDPETLAIRRSNLVLAGTHWNCAGGLSPWGWLSCEETVERGHGYVFLCDPEAERVQAPRRIAAYGRFRHEAATVDPETNIAYLTEDQADACFYRFVPSSKDDPFVGRLEALRVVDRPRFDTGRLEAGERVAVDWVPVDRPDSPSDDVRYRAHAQGAAVFRRGEGMWLADRDLYVCATAGGRRQIGQILKLHLAPQPHLELVAEATDPAQLDMPDNITVAPSGHVYMAEDGYDGNGLRRLTLDGRVVDFARNMRSAGELAGPCFSPDGRTLFVNLQEDGLTLAIRGPFEREGELDAELAAPSGPAPDAGANPRVGRGVASGLAVIALAAITLHRRQRAAART